MTVKKGIVIIFGILFIIWGIYTFSRGSAGIGEIDVYSGALNIIDGAEDEYFDIFVDSPVLIREVQMYQYVKDNKGHGSLYPNATVVASTDEEDVYVKKAFVAEEKPDIKGNDITTGLEVLYENPSFPEEIREQTFCGTVSIGDEGILLSDEMIEKLGYEDYVDFKDKPQLYSAPIPSNDDISNLNVDNAPVYFSGDIEKPQIGDIMVSWYTIEPIELKEEYTAGGVLSENVLQPHEEGIFFYDYRKTKDEISEQFETGNKGVGIGILIVGLVMIAIPVAMMYFEKKKA